MTSRGLIARSLAFAYPGASAGLSGVDLAIEPGTLVALLGANGSGKSTLCRLLAGLLEPSAGDLRVDGVAVHDAEWNAVQYVPQDVDATIIAPRVGEDVAYALRNRGLPPSEVDRECDLLLASVGLEGFAEREVETLSGGERQRLALASALSAAPRYLLLDEVAAHLDEGSAARLLQLVAERARERDIGVLVVTQRPAEARWCDTVVILSGGVVSEPRPPGTVLYDDELLSAAGLAPPAIVRLARALRQQGRPVPGAPLDPASLASALRQCSR